MFLNNRPQAFYYSDIEATDLAHKTQSKQFFLRQLTDKQFEWTVIGARAELKKWGDLDAVFTSKVRWIGNIKLNKNIFILQ